jgi:metal transporter CNNM
MLGNATAMEILPLYLSNLVPEWVALILSVTLLLLVGEILPSAILTGPNQIQIAAMLAPLVYLVLILFSPLAYPISLILDVIVGKDEPITTYNKLELEQLVKIQHEEITKRLTLTGDHGHSAAG